MRSFSAFQLRRKQLAAQLPADSIAFFPANREHCRNGDVHYRFRQDSDFYYLTGFNEPDALLVLCDGKSILFNRARNPKLEQWTGPRLGQAAAVECLGVDEAFDEAVMDTVLPSLCAGKKAFFFVKGRHPYWEERLMLGGFEKESITDIKPLISEMRLFKSAVEIDAMRKAATISVAAHLRAMRACRHLKTEYELEAEILYELTRQGCYSLAYDSIVASGNNACVLHYTANNQPLCPKSLVLIDAGGEYDYYAADITRTYPVSGRFSGEQKAIYELVLAAQEAVIAAVCPGMRWEVMQQTVVSIITQGLCDLGILQGAVSGLIEQAAYKPFYMHGSGHWLGLDVHDYGAYTIGKHSRKLAAGMAFTVEPGLYISKDTPGVDSRWWGIGVRIEDDLLVTTSGIENLTEALPKTIAALEREICSE